MNQFNYNRMATNSQNGTFGLQLKKINWSDRHTKKAEIRPFHRISDRVGQYSRSQIEKFREALNITVSSDKVPNPILDFSDGNFPQFICEALSSRNYKKPTPIQSQGWPVALNGSNLIGVAQTGSGKTLGFIIPAILKILEQRESGNQSSKWPSVVVLSPTRELANQTFSEFNHFTKDIDVSSVCIYGGQSRRIQQSYMTVPREIVVGTPGRVIDFLQSGILDFSGTSLFIVDEADCMLDLGFEKQLRRINSQIPPNRQTLFFTATWPRSVESLARDFVHDPHKINVGSLETAAVHSVAQKVRVVDRRDKFDLLMDTIVPAELEKGGKVLVFTTTKRVANYLFGQVSGRYSQATLIHGEKTQNEREHSLRVFSSGKCPVMIATDVAQRGLDIPGVTCVVNYDLPTQIEDYVHRIGRTGRAGKKGISWTFFTRDDDSMARPLIRILEEAQQEIPEELKEMAENGPEIEINRIFPKPWAERTETEKDEYHNTPITMELEQKLSFGLEDDDQTPNCRDDERSFRQAADPQTHSTESRGDERSFRQAAEPQTHSTESRGDAQWAPKAQRRRGFSESPSSESAASTLSDGGSDCSEDEAMMKLKMEILRKKEELVNHKRQKSRRTRKR